MAPYLDSVWKFSLEETPLKEIDEENRENTSPSISILSFSFLSGSGHPWNVIFLAVRVVQVMEITNALGAKRFAAVAFLGHH